MDGQNQNIYTWNWNPMKQPEQNQHYLYNTTNHNNSYHAYNTNNNVFGYQHQPIPQPAPPFGPSENSHHQYSTLSNYIQTTGLKTTGVEAAQAIYYPNGFPTTSIYSVTSQSQTIHDQDSATGVVSNGVPSQYIYDGSSNGNNFASASENVKHSRMDLTGNDINISNMKIAKMSKWDQSPYAENGKCGYNNSASNVKAAKKSRWDQVPVSSYCEINDKHEAAENKNIVVLTKSSENESQATTSSSNNSLYPSSSSRKGPFINGSSILHFPLCKKPYDDTAFKVDNNDKSGFLRHVDALNYSCSQVSVLSLACMFSNSINSCLTKPSKRNLVDVAKMVVLSGHKFGITAAVAIESVIMRKWEEYLERWTTNTVAKQMTLLYLMYLIMSVETVNFNLRIRGARQFCETFENALTHPNKDVFRALVKQANIEQKEELFSLRCRLDAYFSNSALATLDRSDFWWLQYSEGTLQSYHAASSTPDQPAPVQKKIIEIEINEDGWTTVDDNTDSFDDFNSIIDSFLNVEWLDKFPITEEDKKSFTAKFSVAKPSGKTVVVLYAQNLEFNVNLLQCDILKMFPTAEKSTIIEIAKEALYVENIFGKQNASIVAELLIDQMTAKTPLLQRIIPLLAIHVILGAEAMAPRCKNKLKAERPYCNAFSNDTFVENFRNLVFSLRNDTTKKKLYWMRLVWDSCLLDECLFKIDENYFWRSNGVNVESSKLPYHFQLKRNSIVKMSDNDVEDVAIVEQVDKNERQDEVATIHLLSSEDENECNDNEIGGQTIKYSTTEKSSAPWKDCLSQEHLQFWQPSTSAAIQHQTSSSSNKFVTQSNGKTGYLHPVLSLARLQKWKSFKTKKNKKVNCIPKKPFRSRKQRRSRKQSRPAFKI